MDQPSPPTGTRLTHIQTGAASPTPVELKHERAQEPNEVESKKPRYEDVEPDDPRLTRVVALIAILGVRNALDLDLPFPHITDPRHSAMTRWDCIVQVDLHQLNSRLFSEKLYRLIPRTTSRKLERCRYPVYLDIRLSETVFTTSQINLLSSNSELTVPMGFWEGIMMLWMYGRGWNSTSGGTQSIPFKVLHYRVPFNTFKNGDPLLPDDKLSTLKSVREKRQQLLYLDSLRRPVLDTDSRNSGLEILQQAFESSSEFVRGPTQAMVAYFATLMSSNDNPSPKADKIKRRHLIAKVEAWFETLP